MDIQLFNFDGTNIRVDVGENGEPLFCASDVAKCLGYRDADQAIRKHCDDPLKRRVIDSMGREQKANFIYEGDLYSLVLASKLQSAKRFKHWVTHVVLPAIRKGELSLTKTTDASIELPDYSTALRMLADQLDENRAIKKEVAIVKTQIECMEPDAAFGRAIASCENAVTIEVFAKTLVVDGLHMGEYDMFEYLRLSNFLYKSNDDYNLPYQDKINRGIFVVDWREYKRKAYPVTLVTPKGQREIVNYMVKDVRWHELAKPYLGKLPPTQLQLARFHSW